MLKQQLQQKLQQKLSPQQIQLIRLLELPSIELEERIKKELEENPALDEGNEHADDDEPLYETDESSGDNEDITLGDYMTDDDIPDYKLREISGKAEQKETIPFSGGQSLNEFLLQQLGLRELPEREVQIGEYIIGNLDDDGYLRRDLHAIADDLVFQTGTDVHDADVERVLTIIQDFEPVGIAARDLQECLLIQLQKMHESPETDLAIRVISRYYEAFTKKHYEKIMSGLGVNAVTMKAVIAEITSMNPKPGGSWGETGSDVIRIIPDFIVESYNGELLLSMNNRGVPDLRVNREYADMLKDYAGNKANQTSDMRDTVQFIKQKIDSAQWFIDAVRQRQETMQRTMEAIVSLQKEFFLTGDETKLRPMILKDVAERTGFDISTISRVSNSKYVQTSFGIYSLKYFFSESLQTDTGDEISTREVKKILKDSIDAEDKRKPLTDEELTRILKEKGYIIARRTVAKYREQLGVSVARLRKEI